MRLAAILGLLGLYGSILAQPILIDINPGPGSSYPDLYTPFNGDLYFRAFNQASYRDALYKSDGTLGGTTLIKDIQLIAEYPAEQLTVFNNRLYFSAYDDNKGYELWSSDGTTSGTLVLKDIVPGITGSFPGHFTLVGSDLFFQILNSNNDPELWKTDGTAGGTVKITDIYPAISNKPPQFTACNGILYFISAHPNYGNELWRSDGTAFGTYMVKDIHIGGPGGLSEVSDLTAFNGKLYFIADDGTNGEELWVSDGTAPGTKMLKNINPSGSSYPNQLSPDGNLMYFVAQHPVFGNELFKTDGTEKGTVIIKDLVKGMPGSNVFNLRSIGQKAHFKSDWPGHATAYSTSDGTISGTRFLASFYDPNGFTGIDDLVFFGDHELWVFDSSVDELKLVQEINPIGSAYPSNLTRVGNKLFFRANNGVNGFELWVYEPYLNKVTDFKLVDAITNSDLKTMIDNEVINLSALAHKPVNLQAIVSDPSNTGSVKFTLNGVDYRTENIAPYALAGDNPQGNFKNWNPLPGKYRLVATPFSSPNGTGQQGLSMSIDFLITDVAFGVSHFTLVNAVTDQDIINFRADWLNAFQKGPQYLDLSGISDPHHLNIRANTVPAVVDQVIFGLDGDDYSRVEKAPPYALFGDKNGDYNSWQNIFWGVIGYNYMVTEVKSDARDTTNDVFFDFQYPDMEVSSFSLVNAINNEIIRDINEGDIIDLANLPTDKLNIVANTVPEEVGSVFFGYSKPYREYENFAPYSLYGDKNGNYNSWTPDTGFYSINAIPFSRSQVTTGTELLGIRGTSLHVNFRVIDSDIHKIAFRSKASTQEQQLKLYPNPSGGIIHVMMKMKGAKAELIVSDLFGKPVYRCEGEIHNNEYSTSLNLEHLNRGVYIVTLTDGMVITNQKLVIQ